MRSKTNLESTNPELWHNLFGYPAHIRTGSTTGYFKKKYSMYLFLWNVVLLFLQKNVSASCKIFEKHAFLHKVRCRLKIAETAEDGRLVNPSPTRGQIVPTLLFVARIFLNTFCRLCWLDRFWGGTVCSNGF